MAGHRIDEAAVNAFAEDAVIVAAHNSGFDRKFAERYWPVFEHLRKRLTPLVRKTQAFAKRIAHKAIWVEPKLLAEIEYRAKSVEGKVRHPVFKALREDL